jgi:hypothetical protein
VLTWQLGAWVFCLFNIVIVLSSIKSFNNFVRGVVSRSKARAGESFTTLGF